MNGSSNEQSMVQFNLHLAFQWFFVNNPLDYYTLLPLQNCFMDILVWRAVSASRLVKSPDSHASEPRSRLVGSSWLCYGKFHFTVQWNARNLFLVPPCVKSGKQACLSEGKLESNWPCSIQNIAEFNEIENSSQYSGKSGHTDHESIIESVSAVPHDKAVALAACHQPGVCRQIPYIGSERKNSVRKTSERYKHREEKLGSIVLRPVEIPPLYRIWRTPTTYSCSNMSSWPMSRLLILCCAWMP